MVSGQSVLDSFSSMHLKITFLDVFLKIIPVLCRKCRRNRKTTEEKKLTVQTLVSPQIAHVYTRILLNVFYLFNFNGVCVWGGVLLDYM